MCVHVSKDCNGPKNIPPWVSTPLGPRDYRDCSSSSPLSLLIPIKKSKTEQNLGLHSDERSASNPCRGLGESPPSTQFLFGSIPPVGLIPVTN